MAYFLVPELLCRLQALPRFCSEGQLLQLAAVPEAVSAACNGARRGPRTPEETNEPHSV